MTLAAVAPPPDAAATDLLSAGRLPRPHRRQIGADFSIPDYRRTGRGRRYPMTSPVSTPARAPGEHSGPQSYIGWTRMRDAHPNAGHVALASQPRRSAAPWSPRTSTAYTGQPVADVVHPPPPPAGRVDLPRLRRGCEPGAKPRAWNGCDPHWLDSPRPDDRPVGGVVADAGGFHVQHATYGGVPEPEHRLSSRACPRSSCRAATTSSTPRPPVPACSLPRLTVMSAPLRPARRQGRDPGRLVNRGATPATHSRPSTPPRRQ